MRPELEVASGPYSAPIAPLSTAQLNAAGVFAAKDRYYPYQVQIDGELFWASYCRVTRVVSVEAYDGPHRGYGSFAVSHIDGPKGRRYYFVCPRSGTKSNNIYLCYGFFRSAWEVRDMGRIRCVTPLAEGTALKDRLLGRDGRGPARGERRQVVLQRLRELGQLDLSDPALARAAKPSRVSVESSAVYRPKAGWPRATYRSPSLVKLTFRQLLEELQEEGPPETTRDPLSTPMLKVGECEELSARQVAMLRRAQGGGSFFYELDWGSGRAKARAYLSLQLGSPFLLLEITDHYSRCNYQVISIREGSKTDRIYFSCPVTGTRAETVHLREGRFASRAAQRLVHASQRG